MNNVIYVSIFLFGEEILEIDKSLWVGVPRKINLGMRRLGYLWLLVRQV